ncbi:hypothetical protein MRY87_08310 [bacterium]|nr:hypothetical protein [bacterium]
MNNPNQSPSSRHLWYRFESQSFLLIAIAAISILFLLWRGSLNDDYFVAYWMGALIVFFLLLLSFSVTMECDDEKVTIRYGIGLLVFEIPYYSIAEAGPVKNESLFTFPYNLNAEWALRIVLRNGKKHTVPAQSPKQVAQALLQRRER